MSNRKRPRGRPSKYPVEFQRDAVALVLNEDRSIADVARSVGVNEGTLGNWVNRAREEAEGARGLSKDDREELKRLRGENRELRRANEILKAASVFFASELDPSRTR